MDEPVQKMEKDCSAIVDAQFPEIEAAAKVSKELPNFTHSACQCLSAIAFSEHCGPDPVIPLPLFPTLFMIIERQPFQGTRTTLDAGEANALSK
jgi:hypothetical protein